MGSGVSGDLEIFAVAGASAAAVGLVGLLLFLWVARYSVSMAAMIATATTVAAFTAAVVASAKAMFLSEHDYGVALIVCLSAGLVSLAVGCGGCNRSRLTGRPRWTGNASSRRAGAIWWPGSRMTSGPRWPGYGRWQRP